LQVRRLLAVGPCPALVVRHRALDVPNLGWSFPCAEAVELICRFIWWPCGRVIDIGAGRGLWTKVLMRAFGSDKVVGLDPEPRSDDLLQATFSDWCDETGGPEDADLLFASWLPAKARKVSIWDIRYSTASSPTIRPSFTWDPDPMGPSVLRTSMTA